ncbi:MAG: hypothetical protein JWN40_4063 [Phycisphaerales bacterium]|nr:hypothetical protein [Phycisphaerales bacterium]
MNNNRLVAAFSVLTLLVLLPASALAEKTENPTYAYWAKFKPGSSVTLRAARPGAAVGGGGATQTATLIEVTAEQVTIETKTVVEIGGQKRERPAKKTSIPAQWSPPSDDAKAKRGTEEVTVGGKTYQCKTIERSAGEDSSFVMKTWSSDQVPGGTVRTDMTNNGQTLRTELVEFTAK